MEVAEIKEYLLEVLLSTCNTSLNHVFLPKNTYPFCLRPFAWKYHVRRSLYKIESHYATFFNPSSPAYHRFGNPIYTRTEPTIAILLTPLRATLRNE